MVGGGNEEGPRNFANGFNRRLEPITAGEDHGDLFVEVLGFTLKVLRLYPVGGPAARAGAAIAEAAAHPAILASLISQRFDLGGGSMRQHAAKLEGAAYFWRQIFAAEGGRYRRLLRIVDRASPLAQPADEFLELVC